MKRVHALVGLLCLAAIVIYLICYYPRTPEFVALIPEKNEVELRAEDPFHALLDREIKNSTKFLPKVAIIDSGVDLRLLAKEGIYFPAVSPEWNLEHETSMQDDLGHGSGIFLQLAALPNDFGVVGYLPLVPIPIRIASREALLNGRIGFERLQKAFEVAEQESVRIIGMSLSNHAQRWSLADMEKLLARHPRILVIAAAGNDGETLAYESHCPYVPVCNRAPNLIKVGAADDSLSNRGEVVDVVVASRAPVWRHYLPINPTVFEVRMSSSTSVAVPKVVALSAILWASRPKALPSIIKAILKKRLHQ